MNRRLFSNLVKLLLAISLFPLLGCSSGPPSSAAEEFLRERIKKESQERIKLVGFSKTNGQEAAPMGV